MAEGQQNGFEDSDDEVTAEDLLECLRSNAMALFLGTIRFLEARTILVGDWIDELGATFVLGWDLSVAWTPETFLQDILYNLAAFGGEAVQSEYGEDNASAVIEGFPNPERVEYLELNDVNGDVIFDLIRPIAAACGLDWSWRREGDRILLETARSRGNS